MIGYYSMNYLALDYGSKNIGLAKATSELKIATPFKIIKNSGNILTDLQKIISEEKIDELIVGYPLSLSGERNFQAQEVDKFILQLQALGLATRKQDERFSSKSASAGKTGAHASAAALILQSYLDTL